VLAPFTPPDEKRAADIELPLGFSDRLYGPGYCCRRLLSQLPRSKRGPTGVGTHLIVLEDAKKTFGSTRVEYGST
jgi:hypothetical protein